MTWIAVNDIEIKRKTLSNHNYSQKFYRKSLTLLLSILKMIEQDHTASQIAEKLNRDKQLISYHIIRLKKFGYVKEIMRDVYKRLEITQAGKNFIDQYTTSHSNNNQPICRLENIRFKAAIYKMPPLESFDWKKIELNNWTQYNSQIDDVKIRLNKGKDPTIEFIPSPIDGGDPNRLQDMAFYSCTKVAEKLEELFQIEIGIPEQSSLPEYVVYHPIAKEFSKHLGQVRVEGIGKVNASGPRRIGEFEFSDPRSAAVFMDLPRQVIELKQEFQRLSALHDMKIADLEQKFESLSTSRDRMEDKSEPKLPKTDKLSQLRNKLRLYETTKTFDSIDFTSNRDGISQ